MSPAVPDSKKVILHVVRWKDLDLASDSLDSTFTVSGTNHDLKILPSSPNVIERLPKKKSRSMLNHC